MIEPVSARDKRVTASNTTGGVTVSMREKSQSVDVVSVTGVGAGISVGLIVFIAGASGDFSNPDMRFMSGLSVDDTEDVEISVMGVVSSIHESGVFIIVPGDDSGVVREVISQGVFSGIVFTAGIFDIGSIEILHDCTGTSLTINAGCSERVITGLARLIVGSH